MKLFLLLTIVLILKLVPLNGQTLSYNVTEGKIYKTTIRNDTYKFDHAKYSVFIPDNVCQIKGIFIHQHGCTMEGHGESTAYDLQYQAFATKWGLAIIGPDIYSSGKSNCRDWINPEEGSGPALIAALDSIALVSGHPEIAVAPWLLWGHSGGGYWTLAMINDYPDRIIAAVCYSPAFDPQFSYPSQVAKIPVLIRHAEPGDFNDPGVNCWGTALHTFSKFRAMDGLASIAYNVGQNHNFTYLRYIAIPFFESALAQRLSVNSSEGLKEMDQTKAWLCDTTTTGTVQVYKASTFAGNKCAMSWLPDSVCAAKFKNTLQQLR